MTAARGSRWPLGWSLIFGALCGCADPITDCVDTQRLGLSGEGSAEQRRQALRGVDIRFDAVTPEQVLPGTLLRLQGAHLAGELDSTSGALLEGSFAANLGDVPRPILHPLTLNPSTDGHTLYAPVDAALLAALGAEEGRFTGIIKIQVQVGNPDAQVSLSARCEFDLQRNLLPDLRDFNLGVQDVFPADRIIVDADLLLLEEEGSSLLVMSGRYETDNGSVREVDVSIPLEVSSERSGASFLLNSDILGPEPGVLRNGAVHLVNRTNQGDELASPTTLPVQLRMNSAIITRLTPASMSRGQRVRIEGRGFLPTDASRQEETLLRLDGMMIPDGPGPDGSAEPFPPTVPFLTADLWLDNSQLELVLRTDHDGKSLQGLAAVPARFEGTITPVLFHAGREVEGVPWSGGFTITAPLQVVWLKYLPTFTDALDELFGLKNVEDRVRHRALEVAQRDYAGINIRFQEDRPTDFSEFSILEIGGPDANRLGLFGLDNTDGKDTGNLRLNDIIGGANAASGEHGYPTFGGVFIESFVGFSPQSSNPLPIASSRFDDLLGPFAPFLCGVPVSASEALSSERAKAIDDAVLAFGNVVGNTLVHEIGHSLGLSQSVSGPEAFHNTGDNDYIMDTGADRWFEERSEIDGFGPSRWHPENRRYLREILPVVPPEP